MITLNKCINGLYAPWQRFNKILSVRDPSLPLYAKLILKQRDLIDAGLQCGSSKWAVLLWAFVWLCLQLDPQHARWQLLFNAFAFFFFVNFKQQWLKTTVTGCNFGFMTMWGHRIKKAWLIMNQNHNNGATEMILFLHGYKRSLKQQRQNADY